MIFTLQSHQIADHWNQIAPLLEFGCLEWTPEFVRAQLENAQAQCWCVGDSRIDGIVITQIMKTPHPWGLLWIASGRGLKEGISMLLEHIEPWMWAQGCEFIEIVGRKGWKVLPGYKLMAEVFVKVKQ